VRYTRAYNDGIGCLEDLRPVLPQFKPDPTGLERRNPVRRVGHGGAIRHGHNCPPVDQKGGRGGARSPHADDKKAFPADIGRGHGAGFYIFLKVHSNNPSLHLFTYRNFNVLMATSASAMAIIQNRTITLGSAHPVSSK